jgi:hypothetical protein
VEYDDETERRANEGYEQEEQDEDEDEGEEEEDEEDYDEEPRLRPSQKSDEDLGSMNELVANTAKHLDSNVESRLQGLEGEVMNGLKRGLSPIDLAIRGIPTGRMQGSSNMSITSSFDDAAKHTSPSLFTAAQPSISPSRSLTASPDRLLSPITATSSLSSSTTTAAIATNTSKRLRRRNNGGSPRASSATQLAPMSSTTTTATSSKASSHLSPSSSPSRQLQQQQQQSGNRNLDSLISKSEEMLRDKVWKDHHQHRSNHQNRSSNISASESPTRSSNKQEVRFGTTPSITNRRNSVSLDSVHTKQPSVAHGGSNGFEEERQRALEDYKLQKEKLKRMKNAGLKVSKEEKERFKHLVAFLKSNNDGIAIGSSSSAPQRDGQSNLKSSEMTIAESSTLSLHRHSNGTSLPRANNNNTGMMILSPCEVALTKLAQKREREQRPYEVIQMSVDQMLAEKSAVKKELTQLKAFFATSKSKGVGVSQ